MNVTMDVKVKHSPPRTVRLCSPILPPFYSSPHYIPFKHSSSCIPAMQHNHNSDHSECPLPGDTRISKLLSASSYSSAPTLQFFPCHPTSVGNPETQQCGTEVSAEPGSNMKIKWIRSHYKLKWLIKTLLCTEAKSPALKLLQVTVLLFQLNSQ